MEKLISVIIPVYNVEKYIKECLDSVINQTYKNLQIILVDDGSTDNSGKICDEYAESDDRITVIHQKNQGAGAAKNTGLELVKGVYFSLIDSDDYLELNYYETMVNSLEKNNVDVVQCLFRNVFVNKEYNRNYNFPSKNSRVLKTKEFLFEMLYDWKYAIFANKLFKTSLLEKDIRFPVGRKIDDEFFTYKLICNANKIININDCLYNYRMRKSSVMNNNLDTVLLKDRSVCFTERLEYIKDIDTNLYNLYNLYNNNLCTYIAKCLQNDLSEEDRTYFEKLKKQYKQKDNGFIYKLKMSIKMKSFIYDKDYSENEDKAFL